jgi:ADP-dependent NAD(P)H-hydrate dehydratase / NAD(P)H-hydrate epimerase
MAVRVAGAAEAAECERATIAAGTPASELMERAGMAAATEMLALAVDVDTVTVVTGPGNNGGDGWVVARELARTGLNVSVVESSPPKTKEAELAKKSALQQRTRPVQLADGIGDGQIIVDALLGTGASGAPRGRIGDLVTGINAAQMKGAQVFSLDIPTGIDADLGATDLAVQATHTLTFGLIKRGALISRDRCGSIVALEIGLKADDADHLPLLIDAEWAHERVPPIRFDAHKGTRGRIVVFGGGEGMAGAAILTGTGALRSGAGLVHLVVHPSCVDAVHAGLPEAIVSAWPDSASMLSSIMEKANAVAIGPGLGKGAHARDLVERVLLCGQSPAVVDADALNAFTDDAHSLAALLRGRPTVITPHPAELARILGTQTSSIVRGRFDIGADFARESGAAVLLKGAPTVVFAPSGARYVSASGTAALATGGSGDVLAGIAATLLAHRLLTGRGKRTRLNTPARGRALDEKIGANRIAELAATAAFFHGRAAELCGPVRGTTLSDILQWLHFAWNEKVPVERRGVMIRLPETL